MKIERVSLLNFRQYFGEHRVRFAQHAQQNVTVIHGVNGAGKTSFFLALNWCIYGEGVENIGQIVSKEAISRAKVGEMVTTKVAVTFLHEGERYMATRQLAGQKRSDSTLDETRNGNGFLLTRTSASGVATRVDNPIGVMNTILPSTVRTYFFFDGEKIDNFARPESAQEVQEAIYKVLSLETLTRAKKHLSNAARDLRGQLKGIVGDELKDLLSEDNDLRQQEDDVLERQNELKDNIAAAERHIQEINQQLRDFAAVEALQRQYDLYTREIQERQKEFEELKSKIRDLASQSYISLSRHAVESALQMLDEKRERGEIPSNIRQQFIEDLLERHRCICGRAFADGDEAHKHLVSLLETSVPSSLEDNVLVTSGQLRGLMERSQQLASEMNVAMQDKVRLEQVLERLWAQRDDVHIQMKDSEQIEVSLLAQRRDEYLADKDEYNAELVRNEMTLERIRERIKELEKQIQLARKTELRQQRLSHKVDLAQKAADIIDRAYATFAENKRLEVEQETRNIFHTLAWKGEHFQDVRLTENYQLEVTDRYGLPARPELSAGERQILSLSFITAMARAAQREAPLVMDTPFGRLSSAHREAITRNLPNLAPQLVLFVTDEELRDQALENLTPRIGAEYRLNFDPKTSCTNVEELS